MPLQDITNTSKKFHLHVDLDPQYAKMHIVRVTQIPPLAWNQIQMQGHKAVDLWIDGSIYPMDPLSGSPLLFHKITMLLQFISNGYNGLLGYCMQLHTLLLDETQKKI